MDSPNTESESSELGGTPQSSVFSSPESDAIILISSDESSSMEISVGYLDLAIIGDDTAKDNSLLLQSTLGTSSRNVSTSCPDLIKGVVKASDEGFTTFQHCYEFPDIAYPSKKHEKKCLTEFPINIKKLMLMDKASLTDFMEVNNMPFKMSDEKELICYKVQYYLDCKLLKICKCIKKEDDKNDEDSINVSSSSEEFFTTAIPSEELVDENDCPDVTDEMMLELPPELAELHIDMRKKKRGEVLNTILLYGGEVDSTLPKRDLLKFLFDMLYENARAETGVVNQKKNAKVVKEIKKKSPENPYECCVCMERLVSIYNSPCGHAALCGDCSATTVNCPICRKKVEAALPLYLP